MRVGANGESPQVEDTMIVGAFAHCAIAGPVASTHKYSTCALLAGDGGRGQSVRPAHRRLARSRTLCHRDTLSGSSDAASRAGNEASITETWARSYTQALLLPSITSSSFPHEEQFASTELLTRTRVLETDFIRVTTGQVVSARAGAVASLGDAAGLAVQQYAEHRARVFARDLPFVELALKGVRTKTTAESLTDKVQVEWRLSWVPPSLEWIVKLASSLPWRCEIQRVDITPFVGRNVQFSWRVLFKFWADFVFRRTLRIPEAAIEGRTVIEWTNADGQGPVHVVSVRETALLVSDFLSNRVKNRRIAADFLLYADCCRPGGTSITEWNERVLQKIPMAQKVAGGDKSSVLEVDGLSEQSQTELLESAQIFLFLATCVSLLCGSLLISQTFHRLHHDAYLYQYLQQ
ncbi:hypothetical protein FVE85_1630 [Porphyridium purpureum]|uniref:Uncharacterized protein n=1 Tax=Porphyridium purpureum TaxID=35688 RepID=A0A5J4YW25_PORPP|nr:hypothetical protein FVE85_1630 [Porphyridium purpureum]|eukprot:POR9162..scf209_3